MAQVLQLKKVKKRYVKEIKTFPCVICERKYTDQNMSTYLPPNYSYYEEGAIRYCLRCYNEKYR